MGLTPDPRGLLPQVDVRRLEEWGEAIKKTFSNPIGSTSAKGDQVILSFDEPKIIKNIIIQEDISKGQRVRAYIIHAFSKGEWKKIAQGKSIGHKRIHQLYPIEVEELKLEINQKILPPIIKQFSVY